MTEVKTLNKKELEHEFAKDFGSPYFPILSEMYLRDKDYTRAEKVCTVGLEHNPDNINGYYILSKVYVYNNKLDDAEKLLKILLKKNPLHINALRLIIELQKQLKKPKKNKLNYLNQLLDIFPNDDKIKQQIITIDNSYFDNQKNKIKKEPTANITANVDSEINFTVKPNMATLTFVEILKQQRHYNQALHVLNIIEQQSGSNKKIQKTRTEIKKILTNK